MTTYRFKKSDELVEKLREPMTTERVLKSIDTLPEKKVKKKKSISWNQKVRSRHPDTRRKI